MHVTTLTRRCSHCGTMHKIAADVAGESFPCLKCKGIVAVPMQQALAPVPRPVIVPQVIDENLDDQLVVQSGQRRRDDDKPVKLRLNRDGAEMDVEVDRPTRNAMASTFLGAICALLGAIVVAIFFGDKSKSS